MPEVTVNWFDIIFVAILLYVVVALGVYVTYKVIEEHRKVFKDKPKPKKDNCVVDKNAVKLESKDGVNFIIVPEESDESGESEKRE